MLKTVRMLLVGKILFYTMNVFADTDSDKNTLNLSAVDWCPYSCDKNKELPGLAVEIVQKAFEKSNKKINVEFFPRSRAIGEVKSGKFNAIIGAAITEAPGFIYPKEPITQQQMCFYTLKEDTWHYTDVNSLKNISFGAPLDVNFPGLDDYIKQNKNTDLVQLIPGTEGRIKRGLLKVMSKRMRAWLGDGNSIEFELSKSPDFKKGTFKRAGCLKAENIYIAFSPVNAKKDENELLAAEFTKNIQEMKNNGSISKIMEKYTK